MEIAGIGTQILECQRVRQLLERHADAFLARVLTAEEQAHCQGRTRPIEAFTAHWAAKEAALRCLGLTWNRSILWTNIRVVCEPMRAPRLEFVGAMSDTVADQRIVGWHLSMAHCRAYATATVVACR